MSPPKYAMALAATILTAAVIPMPALAGEVSLSGEASVKYAPDSARLQFTANAEHSLPAKASAQLTETMAQWRKAIQGMRDRLNDYSDANVNLYTRTLPVQERGQQPERLAVASQTVSFAINDLELLNPLLEQAQKIGLQYRLGEHQFFHSDEENLQKQALAGAIDDARSRCAFVAQQLDKACGEVVTININGGHRPVPMMMAEARTSNDTVSNVGPREIRASVNATFKLD
ncbi:MAG: SIMPL domain-containing protein [Marinobacter sp.]